jgi:hypothetical protein
VVNALIEAQIMAVNAALMGMNVAVNGFLYIDEEGVT